MRLQCGHIPGKSNQKAVMVTPVAPKNDYYEIRALPGKGYGCVALQSISRGTRILTDSPLLFVPMVDYMKSDIEAAFDALTDKQKKTYFTLHSSHGQPDSSWPTAVHPSVPDKERQRIEEQHDARTGPSPTLTSIFQTNCMGMDTGAAIFPSAARFNHACNPNACFNWNAKIGKETIHAMRDIEEGEEITVSYCDTDHGKRLRAWELKHYGFVCDCKACGDVEDDTTFAFESEERRLRIQELDGETRPFRGRKLIAGATQPEFANKLLKMAVLLQEEGCWNVRLAEVFLDIAFTCECNDDLKMAILAGKKAVQIKKDSQGIDSMDFDEYAGVLEGIIMRRRRELADARR